MKEKGKKKAFYGYLDNISSSRGILSFPLSQVRGSWTTKTRLRLFSFLISCVSRSNIGLILGNYSVAGFELTLRRKVSHYIITYYLPSGMFVIVSWISFLVPPEIVPGRMTLLVTVFLVLVNIFNTITTNIPKAEGLTGNEKKKFHIQNFSWKTWQKTLPSRLFHTWVKIWFLEREFLFCSALLTTIETIESELAALRMYPWNGFL